MRAIFLVILTKFGQNRTRGLGALVFVARKKEEEEEEERRNASNTVSSAWKQNLKKERRNVWNTRKFCRKQNFKELDRIVVKDHEKFCLRNPAQTRCNKPEQNRTLFRFLPCTVDLLIFDPLNRSSGVGVTMDTFVFLSIWNMLTL